jgi:hypothetical protein
VAGQYFSMVENHDRYFQYVYWYKLLKGMRYFHDVNSIIRKRLKALI